MLVPAWDFVASAAKLQITAWPVLAKALYIVCSVNPQIGQGHGNNRPTVLAFIFSGCSHF